MSASEITVSGVLDTITVENVVASTDIGTDLALQQLALDLGEGSNYDPEKFPGIVYRPSGTGVTTLIFRSGKIVTTGGESIDEIEDSLESLYEVFDELGVGYERGEPQVQNMVASASLETTLNLNAIAIGLGLERVEYEPEQFPGLIYRPDDAPCVVLLFGSGKIVVAGGKNPQQIDATAEDVVNQLTDMGLL